METVPFQQFPIGTGLFCLVAWREARVSGSTARSGAYDDRYLNLPIRSCRGRTGDLRSLERKLQRSVRRLHLVMWLYRRSRLPHLPETERNRTSLQHPRVLARVAMFCSEAWLKWGSCGTPWFHPLDSSPILPFPVSSPTPSIHPSSHLKDGNKTFSGSRSLGKVTRARLQFPVDSLNMGSVFHTTETPKPLLVSPGENLGCKFEMVVVR
ncbi:hypothetical protein EJ08DRAFT_331561 [Tothia fuscella]|uniref:Uncharacterized protein n=1 Tax=Tothia fuscella TaxID=1048955 RepID=A0A9P4NN45_9PEZI|nr:hypothetical protein EJ08DRAFT_331561 [Tothia fuscella]